MCLLYERYENETKQNENKKNKIKRCDMYYVLYKFEMYVRYRYSCARK